MKKNKRSLKNKLILLIIIVIICLTIALLITLFYDFDLNNYFKKNMNKQIRFIDIPDECSLILGNVIHQIRDEGECRIHCNNNCRLEKLNIDHIQFSRGNSSCHKCECYCI